MDDIVDRLRDHQNGGRRAECEEAANQIEALRDMLDSARSDLEMLRQALGVPAEPHQSLLERMVEAAQSKRGAVPDGWQVVPKEPTPEMKAAPASDRPGFSSLVAREIYAAMLAAAPAPDQFRGATKMMAEPVDSMGAPGSCGKPLCSPNDHHVLCRQHESPAEVLMPKPVAYGFGNTAITGHTNRLMMVRIDIPGGDQYAGAFWLPLVLADEAHTYGVACRAAGEAAGYARGLRDAVRDAVPLIQKGEVLVTVTGLTGSGKSAIAGEIEIMCRALGLDVEWVGGDAEKRLTHADWTDALEMYRPRVRIIEANISQADAALRGEVKP